MANETSESAPGRWTRLPGIVGGLGPHAHIEFERRLLAAVEAREDQDYPPWILVSCPQTPDRTAALLGGGPSPVPALLDGLERLAAQADFAVIPCMTAHAFLDELRAESPLPILDLVALALDAAVRAADGGAIGLLATDGTLRTGLFMPRQAAPLLTPLDLDGGEEAQAKVMEAIYGLKSGVTHDGEGTSYRDVLRGVAARLVDAGARAVIAGCTEVGMALGGDDVHGIPVVDPLTVGAQRVLALASSSD